MGKNSASKEMKNRKWFGTAAILVRSMLGWTAAFLLGAVSVFSARYLGLSNMSSAQITIGVLGFAGGGSHYLLIRKTGGKESWLHGLTLSIVWALSCIGGVSPLFFTLGTGWKMAVIAFYSFGIFGALGGIATAFVMRSLFVNTSTRDVIPCVITWSFSFGLAAISNNLIGEGLQAFLPPPVAWSIAFGAMALIIGSGGGYSIVSFLSEESDIRQALEKAKIHDQAHVKESNKPYILVLFLLFIPFYLNDFSDIYVRDWRLWILIDMITVKLFPLLIVLWLLLKKRLWPSDVGLTAQPVISFITVFLIGTLAVIFMEQNGPLLLNHFPGYPRLGGKPEIQSPLWNPIDLTVGLLMVGMIEETVFRGYLHAFLKRYTQNPLIFIVISAVAFGLIHWSGGLHKVIVTSAAGAVFMVLYLRTLSLPAIMLAHFAVNLIDFTNIIPKEIFRFL
ncbi:MAG: type II CAAX endopeptidase family protein [Pseudomonadota bacterium]